eukprot:3021239-Prymnesium_polylepis.2
MPSERTLSSTVSSSTNPIACEVKLPMPERALRFCEWKPSYAALRSPARITIWITHSVSCACIPSSTAASAGLIFGSTLALNSPSASNAAHSRSRAGSAPHRCAPACTSTLTQ